MKKIGLKAILSIMIFSMIFAGNAFANTLTDHVAQAPNGKGDVLIFPIYFASGGWETKLIVTNTSQTHSVVAKVIIRSKENSQELRDFMLYLSPADVWTGILRYDADWDTTVITSTDDSILRGVENGVGVFASTATGEDFTWYLEDACALDVNYVGYVTVIEGASFAILNGNGNLAPGVLKSDIYTAWNSWNAAQVLAPINVLTGIEEIFDGSSSYALNATTLKNYNWDTAIKLDTTVETFLGLNANNTYGEVEAALAKDEIVVPYYSQTDGNSAMATFTFPTKFSSSPTPTNNCEIGRAHV